MCSPSCPPLSALAGTVTPAPAPAATGARGGLLVVLLVVAIGRGRGRVGRGGRVEVELGAAAEGQDVRGLGRVGARGRRRGRRGRGGRDWRAHAAGGGARKEERALVERGERRAWGFRHKQRGGGGRGVGGEVGGRGDDHEAGDGWRGRWERCLLDGDGDGGGAAGRGGGRVAFLLCVPGVSGPAGEARGQHVADDASCRASRGDEHGYYRCIIESISVGCGQIRYGAHGKRAMRRCCSLCRRCRPTRASVATESRMAASGAGQGRGRRGATRCSRGGDRPAASPCILKRLFIDLARGGW